jgi:hypothetical protein
MAYTLANQEDNILIITNLDGSNSLLYTIHVLNTEGIFEAVEGYPTTPTNTLSASSEISVDLQDDGIYKFIIGNLTSTYVLLDADIRLCEKNLTLSLWCDSLPATSCECDPFTVKTYTLLKFKEIKKALYFEWNKWVQTQSITDLITPTSNELLSMSEWLIQLSNICSTCSDDEDCGCGSSTPSNCGCS